MSFIFIIFSTNKICVTGKSNVGKSTIINNIMGKDPNAHDSKSTKLIDHFNFQLSSSLDISFLDFGGQV